MAIASIGGDVRKFKKLDKLVDSLDRKCTLYVVNAGNNDFILSVGKRKLTPENFALIEIPQGQTITVEPQPDNRVCLAAYALLITK